MNRKKILIDFDKALDRFKEAMVAPALNDLIRAGCIKYFEFCFELAWKSIKIFCEEMGTNSCNSPKSSLKQAFLLKWIDNEIVWLEMLSARNRLAHTYDASYALEIYNSLGKFLVELGKLSENLHAEF